MEGEVLNDSENAARSLIKGQEGVVNVSHQIERTSGAVPGPQPALDNCGSDPSSRTSPPRASLAPAQRDLNYCWTERHLILTVAQSPKTAHGEKIPSL